MSGIQSFLRSYRHRVVHSSCRFSSENYRQIDRVFVRRMVSSYHSTDSSAWLKRSSTAPSRAGLRHRGAPCQRIMGALAFPSLSGPPLYAPPLSLSPIPSSLLSLFFSSLPSLRSRPPNTARVSGEHCNLPNGVWGKAPADKRFGAYLSQKWPLWWHNFFVEFFAWIYVIFIIFCTKTIYLQKLCPKLSNNYMWVSCWSCLSDYFERFGSLFPALNIWQLGNTSKYCAKY